MTPKDEKRLLSDVRGIYNDQVGNRITGCLVLVLLFASFVFFVLFVGVAGWVARVFPFFFL